LCCPCSLCWVHHQAHPNELAWWWLTQHSWQGLDHSIVHLKLVFQTIYAIPTKWKAALEMAETCCSERHLKWRTKGPSQHWEGLYIHDRLKSRGPFQPDNWALAETSSGCSLVPEFTVQKLWVANSTLGTNSPFDEWWFSTQNSSSASNAEVWAHGGQFCYPNGHHLSRSIMGCSGSVCNFTLPSVKFLSQEKAPYA